MWFKNLVLFRLNQAIQLTQDELATRLDAFRFRPCSDLELSSYGWTSPLGGGRAALAHTLGNCTMICATREEKILPSSVISEIVSTRIGEIESRDGQVRRKEREALRDEVLHELLPRAFTHKRPAFAYIDAKLGWLVVDSASVKAAEGVISLLRKTLGSLSVGYPLTTQRPSAVMTEWLRERANPADVTIEDECELRSPGEEASIIRCKRQDLSVPEVLNHLEAGKEVIRMSMTWDDQLSFILDESLSLKRLRFLDGVQEQADTEGSDQAEQFDADFSIMSLVLGNFLPRLLELFGGENHPTDTKR
jgi:recombination associated protein RdgC